MKILILTLISFLVTAGATFLSLSTMGMIFTIITLILLFIYNKTYGLVSLFSITLFNSFFINAKTQRMGNYFLRFLKFDIDAENIVRNNITMIVVPAVVFIIFIYTLSKYKRGSEPLISKNLSFIYLFSALQLLSFFTHDNPVIIIVRYLLFFAVVFIFYVNTNYVNISQLFNFIIVSLTTTQLLIIFISSFDFILFGGHTYNGDLIVGTTATSTLFSYLMSIGLLYYIIVEKRSLFIIATLFFAFVLAQSGLQFLIFLIVLSISLKIKYSRTIKSNLVFYMLMFAIIGSIILIVNVLPNFLESQAHQIYYATYRIDEFIDYGFKYNYKINLITEFLVNNNLSDIAFGRGYNSLREEIFEGTAFGVLQARSLVTTPNTLFNNLIYDLGLVRLIIYYMGILHIVRYCYKKYKAKKRLEYLFLSAMMLFIILLSTMMESINHPFIALIMGSIFGIILKKIDLKTETNNQ